MDDGWEALPTNKLPLGSDVWKIDSIWRILEKDVSSRPWPTTLTSFFRQAAAQ